MFTQMLLLFANLVMNICNLRMFMQPVFVNWFLQNQ